MCSSRGSPSVGTARAASPHEGIDLREGICRAYADEVCARGNLRHGSAAVRDGGAASGPGRRGNPAGLDVAFLLQRGGAGGALPVFAEIDDSFGIDPADIEGKITPQTKVILAAHLQGNPCDMDRIMAIAKKHGIRVLEDCAQSVGASYKGRPVGSIADIGIYSLQLNKTITAGEGGAVVTNDPELFEGAVRFHDIGALRPLHEKALGQHRLDQFAGTNFRMNEFSGGVLLAQLRKLDTIVRDIRTNARRVYDGIRDVPNLQLRRLYDPEGELGSGIYLGFRSKELCQRYADGMKAENVPVAPPAGSALLPVQAYIERKHTVHPAWPSFTSQRGRAIQYGPSCCPRTLDIHSRYAGVLMDPKFTRRDCEEIVAAIRKVYPAIAAA